MYPSHSPPNWGQPQWPGAWGGWGGGWGGWGGWGGFNGAGAPGLLGFPSGGVDIIGAPIESKAPMVAPAAAPGGGGPGGGGPGGGPGGGGPGGGHGGPGHGGGGWDRGRGRGWGWGWPRFSRTVSFPVVYANYDPCSGVRNAYLAWRYSATGYRSTLWTVFLAALFGSSCWPARAVFAQWASALQSGNGSLAADAQVRFEAALFSANPYGGYGGYGGYGYTNQLPYGWR